MRKFNRGAAAENVNPQANEGLENATFYDVCHINAKNGSALGVRVNAMVISYFLAAQTTIYSD